MQTRIKKIILIPGLLIVAVLLVLVIVTTLLIYDNSLAEFISHMPVFTATVPTPSMFPTIDQNDVIFVDTRIEFDGILLDDIVVFYDEKMIVHRVIDFKDGNLITKGDHNPDPDDEPVSELMYIGSVVFVFDYGLYLALIILGFGLSLVACNGRRQVKNKRNR